MHPRRHLPFLLIAGVLAGSGSHAFDKNGVAPRAISLPSGPGSIQGLGESFQPQLNSGSGSYQVPLRLPGGTGGKTPALALVYNSGSGNGTVGLGWSLSGASSIRRNTDKGVPRYVDGPNGTDDDHDGRIDNAEELDTYTGANGEELVPLADGSFRAENESGFVRYARSGEGWEARFPDGERLLYGQSAQTRVEDNGRILAWCLEREVDKHGNAIDYFYLPDPATPAQKHLLRARWGRESAFFTAVCRYEEGRPDVASNYQSSFELKTSLRLAGIDVVSQGIPAPAFALRGDFDGDGKSDALIRRFRLEYDGDAHLSLLARVTQLGADGLTAMPTLSFGYSRWNPLDNVATAVIRSRGAPPEGFDSGSVELIDMNGDGLPDLLSTAGSQHRVALNRGIDEEGRLVWAPSRPVGNAPAIDISSDRTHLADATADGLSDLLVKVSNTSFLCFDNTSQNAWTGSPFPIRSTDTWPIWPFDGDGGKLSRSIDADYSRSNDVLYTSDSGIQLWLLLPGGRFSRELRLPPLVCDGKVFRFDLPGTHIADLNGDRLQDLAWIQPSRVDYFPNRGRGEFAAPVTLNLGRTLSAAEIERADFSDVDGDGLVDLTVVRPAALPNGVLYWLNRFERGFDGPRSVLGLPAQRTGDALRWADLNGNGTTDIVISQAQSPAGEKILVVDLVPEGKIHLLTRIENGLGLRIELDYESSTAQMVRAETAGASWSSVMPIAITVVSRMAEDDGRGTVFEQSFTYRDPYYDAIKQEFRGFRSAQLLEAGDASAAGKIERMVFDTGREETCLKGRLLSTELLGEDGKLFNRSLTSWRARVLAEGLDGRKVCFAHSAAVDQFIHEGEAEGIRLRQEKDYDDFGNAIAERNFGMLDQLGDELFIERVYEPQVDVWLLRLVKSVARRDGAGRLLDDQRFFYGPGGDLERIESWLDTEGRWIPTLRQRFDNFGNVIESIDARGHRRTIGFDAHLNAVPLSETVHLPDRQLSMSAEYDLGFGAVTSATDFHGRQSAYRYDPLGRLVEARRPGGAGDLYEYHFGNPVSRVVKRLLLDAEGSTFDSHFYSDCYGRPLGSKIESEGGQWRFLDAKRYNSRKLEERAWLPHASDTSDYVAPDPVQPHEARRFDAAGRLIETRKPDGSLLRQEHRPLAVAVFDGNDTAQGGQPDLRRSDGLGRLTAVEERNGDETYVTRYGWTAAGQLETVVDALGNTKRFRFDSLGRLIEGNDPDRGLRLNSYDDTGNLLRRVDAKGQTTLYRHDAANRLLEKDYVGRIRGGSDPVDCIYHYDAPAGTLDFGDGTQGSARNVAGRLAWVEDSSGEEHFSYDERGNIEWVLKRVRDPETSILVPYRTQTAHDLLNREAEMIFPDNDRLRYVRGAGGFVERIDGGPDGRVVLEGADYAPSGQPLGLHFGTGAESIFEYDASQRLKTLRAAGAAAAEILYDAFTYDEVSNVTEIADRRAPERVPPDSPRRRSAQFTYDPLNRLIGASYGTDASLGRIDYAYDALGNLLAQTTPPPGSPGHMAGAAVGLGALGYEGGRTNRDGRQPLDSPGPHAVTSTEGGHRLDYDANGNVVAYDGGALRWDFEDRIERFVKLGVDADSFRDHSSRRVLKRVLRGDAREETHYVDEAFEVKGGSPIKYAFLDGRRLARIDGRLDPTREAVQRLVLAAGWNLITSAVETTARLGDAFGSDSAVFEWQGGGYAAVESSSVVPFGKPLWVHAPAARLAVLRGRVPAVADRESPGPLHAWPSLSAFRPAVHVESGKRFMVYDAKSRRWLRRDPSLPSFLNNVPETLGAAQPFWSAGAATLRPSKASETALIVYHQDHLGSPAALSDADGRLIEERSHYPYGALRSRYRPAGATGAVDTGGERWDFTGKERDPESGFVEMGARGYLDFAGVFLSPDPRYADVALLSSGGSADQTSFSAFLANPQMGNLYAYAVRNPLKYVDPSGLDVVYSKVLQNSPVFQEALSVFKATKEGQRILAHLEKPGFKVTLSAGRALVPDIKTKKVREHLGATWGFVGSRDSDIEINIMKHKRDYPDGDAMIRELADTIHHELRHAEGNMNGRELAQARRILDAIGDAAASMKLPRHPVDPRLRMGGEVHRGLDVTGDDPFNQQFQREVGEAHKQVKFEQMKERMQKEHPLLEFDID